jgi:hypothetical protein
MPNTYSPANTIVNVAGNEITDWESITAEWDEDHFTAGVATTGRAYRVENLNRMATITIVCKQDSATNDTLSALVALDDKDRTGVGAFGLREVGGTTDVSAEECWVKKRPPIERGKEMADCTWVLTAGKLEGTVGGIS